jgi:hypothetical protein
MFVVVGINVEYPSLTSPKSDQMLHVIKLSRRQNLIKSQADSHMVLIPKPFYLVTGY